MRTLFRIVIGFFAAIGMVLVLAVALGAAAFVWQRGGTVPQGTVLALDLTHGYPDTPPSGALSALVVGERPPLRDVLDAIERAGSDPRVTAILARLGDGGMGTAQAQELRDAIAAFRSTGKRAYAYADSFGEFSPGTRSYYLATAFDEIWLQPLGFVGLVGMRAEEPFFRGTLDKLGVVPSFDHREQYKSALDPATEAHMTAPDREQLQALLDSVMGQVVAGIAAGRKLDSAAVRALIDRGPLMAQEALAAKLVDRLGYADQLLNELHLSPDRDDRLVPAARYLAAAGRPHRHGPTVALIYANGLIQRGDSTENPLTGSSALGSASLVHAFRLAEDDSAVRVILFRIDSPGGSPVASETIWRETERAREHGKKIVVSMGDVAGSGGYYIAAAADKIVAEPATLTGSIGVVAGKLVLNGLLGRIGANWDAVEVGADAGLFSGFEDFTPQGKARFEAFLDEVYAGFKDRVGKGRKLDPAAVEAVAKGRIWSGADAKAHGLVDALGGLDTALTLAKAEAGIDPDSDVTIKLFPPPEGPAERLLDRLLGRGGDDDNGLAASLVALRPLLARLELILAPPGVLTMAPVELK